MKTNKPTNKIYFYGKLRLKKPYLLPSFHAVDIVDDDDYDVIVHRWWQFAWFGLTVNFNIPVKRKELKLAKSFDLNEWFWRER